MGAVRGRESSRGGVKGVPPGSSPGPRAATLGSGPGSRLTETQRPLLPARRRQRWQARCHRTGQASPAAACGCSSRERRGIVARAPVRRPVSATSDALQGVLDTRRARGALTGKLACGEAPAQPGAANMVSDPNAARAAAAGGSRRPRSGSAYSPARAAVRPASCSRSHRIRVRAQALARLASGGASAVRGRRSAPCSALGLAQPCARPAAQHLPWQARSVCE